MLECAWNSIVTPAHDTSAKEMHHNACDYMTWIWSHPLLVCWNTVPDVEVFVKSFCVPP